MKIAIDVSQIIYGTGVSRYTNQLVENLLDIDKKNKYILFGGSLRRKHDLDIRLNRLKAIKKTYHIPPKFLQLIWNNLHLFPIDKLVGDVDLIHTSDWTEPPSKKPKVTTIHDLSFFVDPNYVSPSVRQAHKKRLFWVKKEKTRIIAVSQSTKDDIIKYLDIDPDLIDVVYEAPTITKAPALGLKQLSHFFKSRGILKHFLLVPGSGHPRKNIIRTIKAFKQAKLADHQLVIIGPATEEEKKLASPDVVFTGFIDSQDLPLLFHHADALIYASLYEGFGLPILDAFKMNLPVLTSNLSSMPEIASDAAIIVDPFSVEAIASGMTKVLDQSSELIQKGQTRLADFSWKKTARQTIKVYEHATKK